MSVFRRYWIWIAMPLAALALLLALRGPESTRASGFAGADETQFVRDGKLGRTVNNFADGPRPVELEPLYRINREGLEISIELDAETWSRMLYPANRALYKERAANAMVRFGDRRPQAATLRLRGGGSLTMPGKPCFNLNLLSSIELTPDVKLKHFYLMNQRYDPHHVNVRFAYGLLANLGLFDVHVQFARVTVNGQPLGMFLLLEPPEHAIRRGHPDCVGVYRRAAPNVFERLWGKSVPQQFASIDQLRDLGLDGPNAIPGGYDSIFDTDAFLTWLAVNSAVLNTDSLDELFVFETRPDPNAPGRLGIMAWDYDDIFSPDPRPGSFADPLLFSCSDVHERNVQRNPALNARFRQILGRLLATELSAEKLCARLRAAQALRDSLDDDSPAAAKARAARASHVDAVERLMRERHATLLRELAKPVRAGQ